MFLLTTVIPCMFGLASLILLSITVVLIHKNKFKLKFWSECIGTITGFKEEELESHLNEYETKRISPIIVYILNNVQYDLIGNYYSTKMRVNDTVKLMYDNSNPSKAVIKTSLYFMPTITGLLGTLFLVITISFFIAGRLL